MSPPAPPRNPTDSTSASLLLSGGGGWATFPPHVLNSDLQPAIWGPARLRSAQTPAPRSLHRALELCTAAPTQPPPQHLSLETLGAPLCPGMAPWISSVASAWMSSLSVQLLIVSSVCTSASAALPG